MAIQSKNTAMIAAATMELSQEISQLALVNRQQQQDAVNKVTQAKAGVVAALKEQLKKLQEENTKIQAALAASRQEEAGLDLQELSEVQHYQHFYKCTKDHQNGLDYKYKCSLGSLDNDSKVALESLQQFAKAAQLPFEQVRQQWTRDHPDFFEVRKKFS